MTYDLVAGAAWRVHRAARADPEPHGPVPAVGAAAAVDAGIRLLAGTYAALYWRRRGMVILSAGRRRWVWTAPTASAARAAAAALTTLVETGAWRPGSGPPPALPGAVPVAAPVGSGEPPAQMRLRDGV